MQLYSPASRWSSSLCLTLALWGVSCTLLAHNLYDLPVGTILNFGPNLQTAAGGVCRQPEGLAIDPDGNFYLASNSDSATTVGHVCVIDAKGNLVDIIDVPAGPGAAAIGLVGELWEGGHLYVLDQADNIVPLCLDCHDRITRRDAVASLSLLRTLNDAEYAYAIQRGGEGYFERAYGVRYER